MRRSNALFDQLEVLMSRCGAENFISAAQNSGGVN
jgi:hypothetical protein